MASRGAVAATHGHRPRSLAGPNGLNIEKETTSRPRRRRRGDVASRRHRRDLEVQKTSRNSQSPRTTAKRPRTPRAPPRGRRARRSSFLSRLSVPGRSLVKSLSGIGQPCGCSEPILGYSTHANHAKNPRKVLTTPRNTWGWLNLFDRRAIEYGKRNGTRQIHIRLQEGDDLGARFWGCHH